jgi:hypothetical protein
MISDAEDSWKPETSDARKEWPPHADYLLTPFRIFKE